MITAEISLVPVGSRSGTSQSKEIVLAFDAISEIKDLKAILIPLETQIQSNNTVNILNARLWNTEIISIVYIYERFDKEQNLDRKLILS